MKWTVDASHLPVYLRVRAEGELTREKYVGMWADILSNENWKPGLSVLVDGRELKPIAAENAQGMVTELANYFADRAGDIGPSHIARLVSKVNFQNARTFQYALKTRDLPMVFQIFLLEDDAITWLNYFDRQAPIHR